MRRDQLLDVGHISRAPELTYVATNLRLEHRGCSRRHGQSITAAMRKKPDIGKRMPTW